ncbi:MAG: sigma-70 family RNA polymerase sigma factor [Saprospiraceae bacterium]|nr:sigma-70 family RNA polymerase sigma factor [Saprospiraceae bacterium]
MLNDRELIDSTLRGNIHAFRMLVDRYQDLAYTLALRIVKSAEEAEEVAQDAFIKVHDHLINFRGDSKFTTWLYRIVYTTALNRLRKRKLTQVSLDDPTASYGNIASDSSADQPTDKISMLKSAIAAMSSDDSTVLSLFYFDEMNLQDISQIMDIEANNVKIKLHRARLRLKTILESKPGFKKEDWL